jgi:hypothetical protein
MSEATCGSALSPEESPAYRFAHAGYDTVESKNATLPADSRLDHVEPRRDIVRVFWGAFTDGRPVCF